MDRKNVTIECKIGTDKEMGLMFMEEICDGSIGGKVFTAYHSLSFSKIRVEYDGKCIDLEIGDLIRPMIQASLEL